MKRTQKRWAILVGASVAALAVAGCAAGNGNKPESKTNDQAQATQTADQIYANNCASCHGGNLQGGFGPSLEKIGSKLKKEQIVQVLQKGKGSMPSQGHLSSQEQEKLATWLTEKK
ncbi:c-type cytochrome [Laceyella putida]|jgi:mono/diheme cytochrome c family protein|uniref:C-type cytochrome n=1 Tax=Laceyella putida TaxID=110101 RepID=A0ABW2RGF1_9BACL